MADNGVAVSVPAKLRERAEGLILDAEMWQRLEENDPFDVRRERIAAKRREAVLLDLLADAYEGLEACFCVCGIDPSDNVYRGVCRRCSLIARIDQVTHG